MDRLQPVYTETATCQDCYKCVRECPVKAITVQDGRASVVGELCVLCGHCVEVCPVGAKKVRSDVERAKALIALKGSVALSVAPSFAAEFADYSAAELEERLLGLGFALVSETAHGADSVSAACARELAELGAARGGGARVLVSTACPVVVDYILKYRPALAPLLSAACSPMVAHARELKEAGARAVVFAGPCIAKKREADLSGGAVDAAITFKGLRAWLREAEAAGAPTGASAKAAGAPPGGPDPRARDAEAPRGLARRAGRGALYPLDGGMIAAVKRQTGRGHDGGRGPEGPPETHYVSFSGLVAADRALDGIESYEGGVPVFMELLACEGGCVNGPRCERRRGSVAKRLRVLEYAREAGEGAGQPRHADGGPRPAAPAPEPRYAEEDLRAALRSVGKREKGDELNCSGCGYDSCRAFAAALVAGRAERTMCVSYMRTLAQRKAEALLRAMPSGVLVVDSGLRVVEGNRALAALLGEEAEAAFEAKPGLEGAELGRLLPAEALFARVLAEGGPECVEADLRLEGRILRASVFSIERGAYAGGIFRDVTEPSVQRERVVAQAKAVIDKNLRTVQKIAYLLGENAAETENILDSLIEAFSAPESGGRRGAGAGGRRDAGAATEGGHGSGRP